MCVCVCVTDFVSYLDRVYRMPLSNLDRTLNSALL